MKSKWYYKELTFVTNQQIKDRIGSLVSQIQQLSIYLEKHNEYPKPLGLGPFNAKLITSSFIEF